MFLLEFFALCISSRFASIISLSRDNIKSAICLTIAERSSFVKLCNKRPLSLAKKRNYIYTFYFI